MTRKTTILFASLALAATQLAAAAMPELTRDREIQMALSAAPEHLRDGAAVYVLGAKGLEKVRDGRNGFSCMVEREGPVLAPICFDAEGSRTTLLANIRKAELRAAGKSRKEIQATLASEYASGKLQAPQGPGVAYMLSPEFVRVDPETGETSPVFPPHVMFYAPYKTNADYGFPEDAMGKPDGPFVLSPGTPTAYVIVVPPGAHTH
jgi:hypothetical protein